MELIKKTDNLTFTLNYSDGEKKEVEEGVLFSVKDEKMDIHIGTDRKEVLFTIAECLTGFIVATGLGEEFEQYIKQSAI